MNEHVLCTCRKVIDFFLPGESLVFSIKYSKTSLDLNQIFKQVKMCTLTTVKIHTIMSLNTLAMHSQNGIFPRLQLFYTGKCGLLDFHAIFFSYEFHIIFILAMFACIVNNFGSMF